jgi:hypothetical protein
MKNAEVRSLSDDALLCRLSESLKQSRRVEADVVALIAEVDQRRLYAREASPSMFAWCTDVLHLSEHEAFLRITVARASREHPMLLAMLRDGRLHLSGIVKLAPHLTRDNRGKLLKRATHKTKRQIEELIAELAPRAEAPSLIRKLPDRQGTKAAASTDGLGADRDLSGAAAPAADHVAPPPAELGLDRVKSSSVHRQARPAVLKPIAPDRYKVQFTAGAGLRDKLERLQALMRSAVPDGDLAKIIDLAVTEKLERLEAKRFAKTKAPRKTLVETDTTPKSRHIPAAVRRAVFERDEGRCTYVDARGRRCKSRDRLEFHHHARPFGRGGDHSRDNVRLACRTHNTLMAEQDYGREKMARYRRPRPEKDSVSELMAAYAVRSPSTTARLPGAGFKRSPTAQGQAPTATT